MKATISNLILEELNKYNHKIKNTSLKLEHIKYNKTGGNFSHKQFGEIHTSAKKFEDTNEKIKKLHDKFKIFEIKINNAIGEITKTNTLAEENNTKTISGEFQQIKNKLDEIGKTIDRVINANTLHPSIFPQSEIIQTTNNNEYHELLSLFDVLINNYKTNLATLTTLKDNSRDEQQIKLYEILNESISLNIKNSSMLSEKVKIINSNVSDKLKFNFGEYDKNDINKVSEDVEIYNYTKRLNIQNTLDTVKSGRLDLLLDICDASIALLNNSPIDIENNNDLMEIFLNDNNKNLIESINDDYIKTKPPSQSGGNVTFVELTNKVTTNIFKLSVNLTNCNEQLEILHNLLIKYKIFKVQYKNLLLYMSLVITSNKFTDKIIPYTHINRGLLKFYLLILNKIIEDVKLNNNRPDIMYFYQHHYIVIIELQKFLIFLTKNIDKMSIIDIEKCTNNVKTTFAIFNSFKDILDSHNEVWNQDKINIYARINDWDDGSISGNKVFYADEDNDKMLIVNKKLCKTKCNSSTYCSSIFDNISKIQFSEVFDSESFKLNNNITKYMTLETQLSKKKGIMLMTYGYSGTGKTYTLFGSSDGIGKQGLLQATLNNIRGLEEVRFRTIELYGLGVQYPHYWKDKIEQYAIKYKLNMLQNNEIIIEKSENDPNVVQCFENVDDNFITLKNEKVEHVFKNFDRFINKLDNIRRKEGRIRITSNNPESSRSIVIYEFHLLVEDTYVPFIIVDLPGREEIVETYCNNYLDRKYKIGSKETNIVDDSKKTDYHKALLTCMSVNPLGLSLLEPTIIFDTFNELDNRNKQHILRKFNGNTLTNESFSLNPKTNLPLHILLTIKNSNIVMMENHNCDSVCGQKNILGIPWMINGESFGEIDEQIHTSINSIQYQGVAALIIMNRIILLKKFNVLEKIYEKIIKKHFDQQLDNYIDKKLFLKSFFSESKVESSNETEIDILIDNVINFRTYLAPFEGIFINENIVGLIKVIAQIVMKKTDKDILGTLMKTQDTNLDFETQKNNIRHLNFDLYKRFLIPNNDDLEPYENVARNKKKLRELQQSTYSAQKIYEYNNPFIESIIKVYMTPRSVNGKKLADVSYFKMFYLFTNTQAEKKCAHQWKLLDETLSFINIVNTSK